MKKRNILLCILILLLSLTACGNNAHTQATGMETGSDSSESTEETSGIRMTREYAIEQGILTEEELVGIDFEAMAEYYDWEEGSESTRDVKGVFSRHCKKYPLPGYGFDYTWLVSVTEQEEEFTKDDVDRIKAIGFEYQTGNEYVSMIFDFEERKAYYGYNVHLFRRAFDPPITKETSLTDEQISEIREIINSCAIDEWETWYQGTKGTNTGYFWWGLYYALEDGRIYSHSGVGSSGKVAPDNYNNFQDDLEAFWDEVQ